MLSDFEVVQTAARPAAVIRLRIAPQAMPREMGPAVMELQRVLAAQGVAAAGPLFTYYHAMRADEWEFDVGYPVAAPVAPAERVAPGELPAHRVARTVYHGPYERLPVVWGEFMARIKADELRPAPQLWESYVTGPESGDDPTRWRTELHRVLLD